MLRAGHALERYWHDYGIDLAMHSFSEQGEYENGVAQVQVKATDALRILRDRQTIAVFVERAHLRHWLLEPEPVILIAFDAVNDTAYWLDIKQYFAASDGVTNWSIGITVTIHVAVDRVFDMRAVQQIADSRNRAITKSERSIRDDVE